MDDHGGVSRAAGGVRRSRIAEYADMTAPETTPAGPVPEPPPARTDVDGPARRRREAAALLGEFRRTAVLLPLSEDGAPLTADSGGIRWIYAFSDETALARFALARGEGAREWVYDRVRGARLLDAAIPSLGVPCGVALDVGSGAEGTLFPPVKGIVPDTVAVDGELTR
ncbi:hypothetical protein ABZS96_07835 [Streptomyces avermitilis]|uniref:hypothetical protein n=1 Tax=Streptomyces avermitilis TaxID=33903 RepID=UPI0033A6240D